MRTPFTSKFLPNAGRVLLALAFAGCLAAPVMAQQPDAPPPPPAQGPGHGDVGDRQLEHMTKALNLTPDQASQVKAIHADSRQKMMALRDDTSVAGPDKHARMKAIHDDSEAKIKALLDDTQKAKYDQMQAKIQERRSERREGGDQAPPPPPPPSQN